MRTLHDAACHSDLRARLAALRSDAPRQWGRMSVGQMLWHVNAGLSSALGELTTTSNRMPFPPAVMRTLVLHVPWPKGAPTMPELMAHDEHDFAVEQARCLELVDRVATFPLDGAWPVHPGFGRMAGRHWSALQAKHIAHHLTQFGA